MSNFLKLTVMVGTFYFVKQTILNLFQDETRNEIDSSYSFLRIMICMIIENNWTKILLEMLLILKLLF